MAPRVVAETVQDREADLRARYLTLEGELEAAPSHRVGTFWWDERTKEISRIDQRLGR